MEAKITESTPKTSFYKTFTKKKVKNSKRVFLSILILTVLPIVLLSFTFFAELAANHNNILDYWRFLRVVGTISVVIAGASIILLFFYVFTHFMAFNRQMLIWMSVGLILNTVHFILIFLILHKLLSPGIRDIDMNNVAIAMPAIRVVFIYITIALILALPLAFSLAVNYRLHTNFYLYFEDGKLHQSKIYNNIFFLVEIALFWAAIIFYLIGWDVIFKNFNFAERNDAKNLFIVSIILFCACAVFILIHQVFHNLGKYKHSSSPFLAIIALASTLTIIMSFADFPKYKDDEFYFIKRVALSFVFQTVFTSIYLFVSLEIIFKKVGHFANENDINSSFVFSPILIRND